MEFRLGKIMLYFLCILSLLSIVDGSPSLIESASDFFYFDYNRVDDFKNPIYRYQNNLNLIII